MQTITATNSGGTELTIGGPESTNLTTTGEFSLSLNSCIGKTLAPGASCTVDVKFKPISSGLRSAVLNITSTAPSSSDSATISATGEADNEDTDGDGLPDGMERVLGMDWNDADSDDDGKSDHQEYPFAGVPPSDPCAGPNVSCIKGVGVLFRNGFE